MSKNDTAGSERQTAQQLGMHRRNQKQVHSQTDTQKKMESNYIRRNKGVASPKIESAAPFSL